MDLWILDFFEFIAALVISAGRFIYYDCAKKIEASLFIEGVFVGELNGIEWIVVQGFVGIRKPESELIIAFIRVRGDMQLNIER